MIKLSENISLLRRERKITQEELAEIVGVTKSAVSKWENGQSTPDVLLLPQLATFFGITIDELLGYKPQLDKKQIMKKYRELAENYVNMPFWEAMEESRKMVQKYYSCYPFLIQISILWINHYMLAEKERQQEILHDILMLCEHILDHCKDIRLCKDVIGIKAITNLQMGRYEEVVEILEDVVHTEQLNMQSEGILTQAYFMGGNIEKARETAQIGIYTHLLSLMSEGIQYLQIQTDNLEVCQETIEKLANLEENFELRELHPNTCAQFHYQAAMIYGMYQKEKEAIEMLQKYVEDVYRLLVKDKMTVHGNTYFNKVENWLQQEDMYTGAPREAKFVWDSVKESMKNPCFDFIRERKEFKSMEKELEGGKENGSN